MKMDGQVIGRDTEQINHIYLDAIHLQLYYLSLALVQSTFAILLLLHLEMKMCYLYLCALEVYKLSFSYDRLQVP